MTFEWREHVEAWLLKAELDIVSAERLLEIEPMILDNACFHCQQAIEKSLKAFLYYHKQDVDRTHNIIFLLDSCAKIDPIFSSIDPMDINAFAVRGRYPDSTLTPEIKEAQAYYALAIHVYALVKEKIIF